MFKKVISIILSLIIIFSLPVNMFAAQGQVPWEEIDSKYDVPLNKEWTVKFNRKVKMNEIDRIQIVKGGKIIPIDWARKNDREIIVQAIEEYQADSKYTLQVFLRNQNKYKMDFYTRGEENSQDPDNKLMKLHYEIIIDELYSGKATVKLHIDNISQNRIIIRNHGYHGFYADIANNGLQVYDGDRVIEYSYNKSMENRLKPGEKEWIIYPDGSKSLTIEFEIVKNEPFENYIHKGYIGNGFAVFTGEQLVSIFPYERELWDEDIRVSFQIADGAQVFTPWVAVGEWSLSQGMSVRQGDFSLTRVPHQLFHRWNGWTWGWGYNREPITQLLNEGNTRYYEAKSIITLFDQLNYLEANEVHSLEDIYLEYLKRFGEGKITPYCDKESYLNPDPLNFKNENMLRNCFLSIFFISTIMN